MNTLHVVFNKQDGSRCRCQFLVWGKEGVRGHLTSCVDNHAEPVEYGPKLSVPVSSSDIIVNIIIIIPGASLEHGRRTMSNAGLRFAGRSCI